MAKLPGSIVEKHRTLYRPFFFKGRSGFFYGKNRVRIVYRHFKHQDERSILVIVPGRTESTLKYAETIHDYYSQGYSVFIFDHRGQGFSERMLRNPQIGYVDFFQDYADDLETFLTLVVGANDDNKVMLLAHSMGGAVTCLYVSKFGCEKLSCVAMSCPMLKINFDHPENFVKRLVDFQCRLGRGKEFAMGMGPMDVDTYGDELTSCPERLYCLREILTSYPEIQLGGPSNRWASESIATTLEFRKGKGLNRFTVPTLLLEAGKDTVVVPRTRLLHQYIKPVGTYAVLDDAKHDLFIESDPIRNRVMQITSDFFEDVARS